MAADPDGRLYNNTLQAAALLELLVPARGADAYGPAAKRITP